MWLHVGGVFDDFVVSVQPIELFAVASLLCSPPFVWSQCIRCTPRFRLSLVFLLGSACALRRWNTLKVELVRELSSEVSYFSSWKGFSGFSFFRVCKPFKGVCSQVCPSISDKSWDALRIVGLRQSENLASIFGTEKYGVNCPFYFKIGACRHGDRCSWMHNRPTISVPLCCSRTYIRGPIWPFLA